MIGWLVGEVFGVLLCPIAIVYAQPKESLDGDVPEGDVSGVVCTLSAFAPSPTVCVVHVSNVFALVAL